MNKKNTKIIVGVLIVLGVLFVIFTTLGGKKDEENMATQNEIETKGTSTASLPNDMPQGIPMYPGAIIKNVTDNKQGSERNITISLTTGNSVADVNTWYRGALSENGWSITSDKNVGGYVLLKGEKENTAIFTQTAKNTDINLITITQRVRIR